MITSDQIGGIIRAVAAAAIAYIAGKGWIGPDTVNDLTAAVVTIGVAVWSLWNNRPSNSAPK